MYQEKVGIGTMALPGDLRVPERASGLVVFAHGSGSSRLSPRNLFVAEALHRRNLATLLFDLLTDSEAVDRANVFNISLLAKRLVQAIDWSHKQTPLTGLPIGLFGASTGAAAALAAAAERPLDVAAVVSRGGRPDLAMSALFSVRAPTLLIVGEADPDVLALNRQAYARLTCEKRLDLVPLATHLFAEEGALERVAELAREWFADHLSKALHRLKP